MEVIRLLGYYFLLLLETIPTPKIDLQRILFLICKALHALRRWSMTTQMMIRPNVITEIYHHNCQRWKCQIWIKLDLTVILGGWSKHLFILDCSFATQRYAFWSPACNWQPFINYLMFPIHGIDICWKRGECLTCYRSLFISKKQDKY